MSGMEMREKITKEMISAGIRACNETPPLSDAILVQNIYAAMSAAQPCPADQGDALSSIAAKLRAAGANLHAPPVTGTIEGSVATGLSIALALVEEALTAPPAQAVDLGQIPPGFVLVPEKFGIPAEVWESVEFVIGGPGTGDGEAYLDSTAWIGDLIQDDGSAVYGLHLSCDECPEEGSVTLSEFTARPEAQS